MISSRPSEREDRILDVPDVLHHGYPEVVALPAAGGEPEVDDEFPGKREEHHHRDRIGEEAGGGAFCEHGDVEHRGSGEEEVGEGRDERDLPAEVVAGDDLEDDEDEREVDDREPEEGFEGFPHPVGIHARVLEGVDPEDEHGKIGRGEVAHVGDESGICRHAGDLPDVGEHHQDGGSPGAPPSRAAPPLKDGQTGLPVPAAAPSDRRR